jgi:predicted ATPase/class 3 adenylate cyclase
MTFDEILDQAIEMLQRRKRVSYRALKLQFKLDDEYLDVLKEELIDIQQLAVDQDGRMLVWTGDTEGMPEPASQPTQTSQQEVTQQDQPVQLEPPPLEPDTPDAERRQLTVMFSDLVDSTKLSGQLDPEDYREVLRAYQSACSEVIQRFDGYIAQHLGDALLVYFGYPHAHEDDAQRAIHAGLGMLDAMQALNARLEQDTGLRLAIRVGIHTGLTVIGDVGSGPQHELLALGEAPNIASRIQGIAAPNTIAISAATSRLIHGYFTVEDLGRHTLKGVADPQQVYRVLGASGVQSRLDMAVTRGLTPLVGRDQEVGVLLDRWHQVTEGHGHVVLLGGEAGIGKSRLVQVLKDHVAQEPHFRWECRCSPYFHNSALYPVIDLFQRAFQFQPDDGAVDKLRKMEETVHPYVSVPEVMPLFASLLSVPFDDRYAPLTLTPERQKHKTLEAVLTLLLAVAARQPVLLILEDLHWADPSTLELLALLLDQVPTAQLLTLLTCRPAFQPTWSHRSYLTEVTVNRLSRSQIAQMVVQITGGKPLPAEIMQQLVEKTDGVPLFVEELTKTVLEAGFVQETHGHYALTGTLPPLAIPSTLHDSLMARLDRLSTAKGVVQLGATLGRQFSYDLLQAVAQRDERILQHELGRLVAAELLYQRGLPPHVTYTFKHALIQEVAYQSLLKSTRQQYHQRIAQVLEARFPEIAETQPELLAHHATEAGLTAPAVGYWHHAGAQAVQRSAYLEAMKHCRTGLALLETLPETPQRLQHELDLLITLGPALMATQGQATPEVEQVYARAHGLCQQVEATPQLFPVLQGLWNFYVTHGRVHTAHEIAEQALHLAQQRQEPPRLMEAHRMVGVTLFAQGAFAPALANLEQALALATPPQSLAPRVLQDPAVGCHSQVACILWCLGYPDQARTHIHEALALSQQLAHPYNVIFSHSYAASVSLLRRDAQAVHRHADVCHALATEQRNAFWAAWATMYRGWALAMQGQGEEGAAQIQQGLAAFRATGGETTVSRWLALLAEVYGNMGQTEAGLTAVAEAFAHMDKTGERYYEAELHRLQGELLRVRSPDNQSEAEACFHQAIAIARSQQAKSWELRAATSLARLWQSQGKCQEGRELLVPVYEWFTEGFDTADLRDAKALLDTLVENR